jgi:hypothetical protein
VDSSESEAPDDGTSDENRDMKKLQPRDDHPQAAARTEPQNTACIASPRVHLSQFRSSFGSVFIWPTPGEIALRRRITAPPEIAAHPTGAVVDCSLATIESTELNIGSVLNATDEESSGACCMPVY